jgi:hypothetical protein
MYSEEFFGIPGQAGSYNCSDMCLARIDHRLASRTARHEYDGNACYNSSQHESLRFEARLFPCRN